MANKKKRKIEPGVEKPQKRSKKISSELILILACLAILGYLFISLSNQFNHLQDDSFITFRYVKNFLAGHGLVFNPGERVEGYTSFLWLWILTAGSFIGFDIVNFAQALGIAFGLSALVITYLLTKRFLSLYNIFGSSEKQKSSQKFLVIILKLIPVSMLTFNGAFQYWSVSGMEVTFFITLQLLAIYFYLNTFEGKNHFILFSILSTLATLARPEGFLFFVLMILHYWIWSYRDLAEPTTKKIFGAILQKKNLIAYSIFIVPNFILLLFRVFYYGYPLPNTFYAKTGFSSEYFFAGLDYVCSFLTTYMFWGLILFLTFFLFIRKEKRIFLWLFFSIIILNILYTIFIGGDALPLFRFILPITPLIYILFTVALYSFFQFISGRLKISSKSFSYTFTILVSAVLIYYNSFTPMDTIKKLAFYENQLVTKMVASGTWLNEKQSSLNRKLVVACTTIGAVSYYSDATIIDMLGLTDETIAHHPKPMKIISGTHTGWKERNYNVDYVLSRKPDYIYFSTGIKPSAYAERALFTSEDFMNYYFLRVVSPIPDATENIYQRKTEIDSTKDLVKFSSNPNFSLDYIDLYVRTINMRNDPQQVDQLIYNCEQMMEIGPLNFSTPCMLASIVYDRTNNITKSAEYAKKAISRNNYDMISHLVLMQYYIRERILDSANSHKNFLLKYDPEIFPVIRK